MDKSADTKKPRPKAGQGVVMGWRKMTWAIVVWTVAFLVWGASGVSAVSDRCRGMTGRDLDACQAGTAIGGTLGLSFIFALWFVGFVVLAIVWFMSRPRESVVVYGPQGQQVSLTEDEAARRVAAGGWTYTAPPPDRFAQ